MDDLVFYVVTGLSVENPLPRACPAGEGEVNEEETEPQEARRKLFSFFLRHQEWNWDYRFLIVRTPRWCEMR
jgi:hypothetical protein